MWFKPWAWETGVSAGRARMKKSTLNPISNLDHRISRNSLRVRVKNNLFILARRCCHSWCGTLPNAFRAPTLCVALWSTYRLSGCLRRPTWLLLWLWIGTMPSAAPCRHIGEARLLAGTPPLWSHGAWLWCWVYRRWAANCFRTALTGLLLFHM